MDYIKYHHWQDSFDCEGERKNRYDDGTFHTTAIIINIRGKLNSWDFLFHSLFEPLMAMRVWERWGEKRYSEERRRIAHIEHQSMTAKKVWKKVIDVAIILNISPRHNVPHHIQRIVCVTQSIPDRGNSTLQVEILVARRWEIPSFKVWR